MTNPTPTAPGGPVVTTPTIDFGDNFPARVTAIGDSITAGTEGLPYPARLQAILRGRNPEARVINRGEGGQSTFGGLGLVNHALVTDRPGFMLIMEGTNDVRQFVPEELTAGNLREMVRRAKGNKTVPILATIPRELGAAGFFADAAVSLNVLIRQIATDEKITLADVFAALPDATYFSADGFHPNDRGYDAIASTFDSALARAGYPMARVARRRR